VGRAVGPVVAPADDDVAAGEGVAVVAEIAALKFEFEVDALPALGTDLALGFAVREAGLHGLDGVAEFFGDHAEEQYDTLFVDRLMTKATEIHGLAVGWAAFQGRVAKFAERRAAFVGWRKAHRPFEAQGRQECLCHSGVRRKQGGRLPVGGSKTGVDRRVGRALRSSW